MNTYPSPTAPFNGVALLAFLILVGAVLAMALVGRNH